MAVKTKSERGPAGTLTVDDLTRAIKNSIDRTGMKEEEARAMAQHVLNFFGYSERIIDNVLEPEDRDAFYMLEDSGILTTEREETTLYDGREWRIHYWIFRKERIAELVEAQKAKEEAEKMGSSYDDVPEDFWASRKEKPEAPKSASGEGQLNGAAVAPDEIHRERLRQGHPSVAERERPIELLHGPQGFRAQLVREIGAVRVPGGDQGEGQPELGRLVRGEDGRETVEGRPVERVRVPLPRAALRLRLREETRQALLLDDEPGVQPAEFERDPSVEGAGGRHAAFIASGGLSFPGSDRVFNPDSVPDSGGGNWQPASLVLAVAPRISSERCSARTAGVPCPQGRRRRPALRRCTRRPEPTEARCLACHRRGRTWGGASKSTARRPDFSCSSSAGSFHGFRSLGCWEACSCSSARSS